MEVCIGCGAVVENAAVSGVFCTDCHLRESGAEAPRRIDALAAAGLAVVAVPFVFSVRVSESSGVSGPGFDATTQSSLDYVALGAGALAAVLAVAALLRALRASGGRRAARLAAVAALGALAALHLARGAGVV